MPEACAPVRELLPWLVNRTLAEPERCEVERHLSGCATCRAELAELAGLAAALGAEALEAPSPHPSNFRRLLARIDEAPDAASERVAAFGRLGQLGRLWRATPRAVRWATAASWIASATLGGGWLAARSPEAAPRSAPTAEFRTLADRAAASRAGAIRVVFDPATPESEVRALLLRVSATIVDGPSPLGAYTLRRKEAGEPDDLAIVLALLRADPNVRFAEPIVGADAR